MINHRESTLKLHYNIWKLRIKSYHSAIRATHLRGTMLQTTPFCSADEPFLFELYTSTRAAELQSFGWDEAMQHTFLTMQWTAQQRSYAAQYPNADHRIIIFRNVRTGRILVSRTEAELHLIDLTLLPTCCNQGIGTTLLHDLQSEATAANKPLRLSVLKTNPAKRLYERLGFITTGDNGLYDFMEWRMATN
jgi:GNAT superfamily N-acetyltransferase